MYRCALLIGLIFLALPVAAQERSFDLEKFERIDVSAGLSLDATVGGPQSVIVHSTDGDYSDLYISVKNRTLIVSREFNRLRWHQKKADFHIVVTAPKITGIEASSGSNSTIKKVDAPAFYADLSSGSRVLIDGRSDECTIDISSGANLAAHELKCNDANIDVSSGGHGEISVKKSLVADASSGGHVSVYGSPERVFIDKSSGGQIKIRPASQANRD